MPTQQELSIAIDKTIGQIITECHKDGMTLIDILDKLIEPSHRTHDIIRIYKILYPSEFNKIHPTLTNNIIYGSGNPMVFACNNGYIDLTKCVFVSVKTVDSDILNSHITYPNENNYTVVNTNLCKMELKYFLDSIFPKKEIQDYVLNLYAEKLDGIRRRKEFIIHLGACANGRTAFQALLRETFGDYYQNSVFDTINTIKQDTRIVNFANEKIKSTFNLMLSELAEGVHCNISTPPIKSTKDYGMYMASMERNDLLYEGYPIKFNRNDRGVDSIIRIIPYSNQYIYKKNGGLGNYNTLQQPQENIGKIKQWVPYFMEMLFERYKILKANSFMDVNIVPNDVMVS